MSAPNHAQFPPFPLEDWRRHEPDLAEAMQRVLASGSYILGDEVKAFEAEFAAYLNVRHVVGVASGTDAIEVMMRALDIGPGSQVVVPSFAPSAVAAGVTRGGAGLVLADVTPGTFTLCPESLEAVLRTQSGRGVKAVLAVHLFGHPVDWHNLQMVADGHGVLLLEDCAQAHGALWQGRMSGGLGRAAAFSFYPTKNLGAIGDAGAVATNDDELASRLRSIRQYGWRSRHISEGSGVNSRLDELQAAILRVKLRTLAQNVAKRRKLAAAYDRRLAGVPDVITPLVRPGCEHAYHQYVLRCRGRDRVLGRFQRAGVPVTVHYPMPLHCQPAFGRGEALPESDQAAAEVLSLPFHPHLDEAAVHAACEILSDDGHADG